MAYSEFQIWWLYIARCGICPRDDYFVTPFHSTLNPSLHLTWLKIVLLLSLGASHYVSTIEKESGKNKGVVLAGNGSRTCL